MNPSLQRGLFRLVVLLVVGGVWAGTSPALALPALPVSGLFDDFNDGLQDVTKWVTKNNGTGVTVQETGSPTTNVGELRVDLASNPDNGEGGWFGGGYQSNCALTGDFDIRADFRLIDWYSWSETRVGLNLVDLTGTVHRVANGFRLHTARDFVHVDDPYYFSALRLVRTGGTLTGYYRNSYGGWNQVGSSWVGQDLTRFAVLIWSGDDSYQGGDGAFDNVTVIGNMDCATVLPAPMPNPEPVPTPDPIPDPCNTVSCDPPTDPCDTVPCDPPTDPCDVAPCDPPPDPCDASCLEQLAGACGAPCGAVRTTPPGQVLVLDANVLQGNMKTRFGGGQLCPDLIPGNSGYEGMKSCDAAGRRTRFVRRVRALSEKLVETGGVAQDGMGFAPDILALQELYGEDARSIRDLLNAATGYTMDYGVAITANTFATGAQEANNAILYSRRTMRPIDSGGYYVTEGGGAPTRGQLFMGFQEIVPETGTEGLRIAVASVHYPLHHLFWSEATADAKKAEWSRAIAERLETRYGVNSSYPTRVPADRFVIAGDFNSGKCGGDLPDEGEPVDASSGAGPLIPEDPTCVPRQFWTDLAAAGYVDTINAANAATIEQQYRDANTNRKYRIDHIFSKGINSYLSASFDVSCGADAAVEEVRRNCKWLKSPDRYSDHRLLWAMIGVSSP